MPNTPEDDLQVENETVEPYRAIMIFRTLQRGKIVFKGGETKRSYPAQTFFAIVNADAMPGAFDGKGSKGQQRALVGHDVETVRGLIDRYAPGTGNIQAPA